MHVCATSVTFQGSLQITVHINNAHVILLVVHTQILQVISF